MKYNQDILRILHTAIFTSVDFYVFKQNFPNSYVL